LIGVLDTLQQINGHKVLDSTEYSYDVLKNANGKLIYINRLSSIKSPYSLHIYVHYFDEQGSTYAFQKKEVMFFDGDNPKLVMDDHVVYYDKDFRVIGETDTVKNTDHKIINLTTDERKKMAFKYDSYRNLTSCLKGYRIRLKN
jgi:YD repeat-containing protein